jgi:hypothetical protein
VVRGDAEGIASVRLQPFCHRRSSVSTSLRSSRGSASGVGCSTIPSNPRGLRKISGWLFNRRDAMSAEILIGVSSAFIESLRFQ